MIKEFLMMNYIKDKKKIDKELTELVLVNLSFFEEMTLEAIILDFDNELLLARPDFNREELLIVLDKLRRRKLVMTSKDKEGNKTYKRCRPPKSIIRRIKEFFS